MKDDHSPETIFEQALEIDDPQARVAYLEQVCGEDEALQGEIESLIAAHGAADANFMNTLVDPVWGEIPGEKEGDSIGRYKLLQQIGEGGFGTVYMAEQTEPVKRKVALKVIKAGMDSKEVIARFEAERQALALMDHPHIAKVHDAGTTEGGRPYFVMELVKGVPLTNYCKDKGLDTKARLALFSDVCAAVQHAHQKGIIHRDLKPANILVSPHDGKPVVKVIDFGIAKAIRMELTEKTVFTQLGRMIGTPQYMSPEQAELNALDVDTRSDIYSLGVVLYELLTGTTPLDGEQLRSAAYGEMQRLIREETPPKPSTRVSTISQGEPVSHTAGHRALQGDLDWIVMKALEKERDRRYETANALAQDLERHLRDEPVSAGPPSAGYRLKKFVRRNRRVLLSSAAAAVALLIGLAVAGGVWFKGHERVLRIEGNADNLIEEAEELMAGNAASVNYDDDSSFRRASELSQRAAELLKGNGRNRSEVKKRAERLMNAVRDEERARNLITGIEDALIKEMSEMNFLKSDPPSKSAGFATAFGDFGLNPLAGRVEDTVERITARRAPLRDRILVGLVAWADSLEKTEAEQAARLDEIIALADSDPWRRKLRQAIKDENSADLEDLIDSPEMRSQPVMTVLQLSSALEKEQLAEATVKLLRHAQQAAPENFWTNYTLGITLAGAIDREEGGDVRYKGFNIGTANFGDGSVGIVPKIDPIRPAFDKAIGFLRAAVAARPDAEMARLFLGVTLVAGGHLDEAIATNQRTASRFPEIEYLDLLIGTALLRQERLSEAIPYLRSAAEQDGVSYSERSMLGFVLAQHGQYGEAREEFMKAVEIRGRVLEEDSDERPRDEEYYHIFGIKSELDKSWVQLFIAFTRVQHGKDPEGLSKALAACRDVLEGNPKDPRAHVLSGFILSEKGELQAAKRSLERAIQLGADSANSLNLYGMTLMQLGDATKGLTYIEKAAALKPEDATIQINLGACLMLLDRIAEAEVPTKSAVRLNPGNPMAWNNLGAWHNRQGDNLKAMEYFRKANALDSNDPLSTRNLAEILFRTEKYEESISCYQRLNDPEQYLKLAAGLMAVEMFDDAIDALERAVALKPDYPDSLNQLALAYLKADRGKDALPALEKLLVMLQKDFEKDGEDGPKTLGDLAGYYSIRGRQAEGITLGETLLNKARKDHGEEAPETQVVMRNLAGLYLDAGDLDDGFKLLEAVLAILKKAPGAEDPVTLKTMNRLAIEYKKAGRQKRALELQEEALKIIRRVHPEDFPMLLDAVELLAVLDDGTGEDGKLLTLKEEGLELSIKVRGEEDEHTLGSMTTIAISLFGAGRLDDAIAMEERSLEIKRRVLPQDHPIRGMGMALLGDLYFEKGEIAKALALHEELLDLRCTLLGSAHSDTTFTMKHLLEICIRVGQLQRGALKLSEHLKHLSDEGQGPESELQVMFRGMLGELAEQEAKELISPAAIARYYAENQDSFRETSVHLHKITVVREGGKEARAKQRNVVEALLAKIKNGTPFVEVAREHSDDNDPYKEEGGDNGRVTFGDTGFLEHLEKAIFSMKPGSLVIHESEEILWILKVEDRMEGEVAPLGKVRAEIAEILSKLRREKLVAEWLEEGRKAADGK